MENEAFEITSSTAGNNAVTNAYGWLLDQTYILETDLCVGFVLAVVINMSERNFILKWQEVHLRIKYWLWTAVC